MKSFSFDTVSKALLLVASNKAMEKTDDYRFLLLAFLASELHLCLINSVHVIAKDRSAFIVTTILLFISIIRISPMLKRTMILEFITNVLLVLNKGFKEIRHTTSKL